MILKIDEKGLYQAEISANDTAPFFIASAAGWRLPTLQIAYILGTVGSAVLGVPIEIASSVNRLMDYVNRFFVGRDAPSRRFSCFMGIKIYRKFSIKIIFVTHSKDLD